MFTWEDYCHGKQRCVQSGMDGKRILYVIGCVICSSFLLVDAGGSLEGAKTLPFSENNCFLQALACVEVSVCQTTSARSLHEEVCLLHRV